MPHPRQPYPKGKGASGAPPQPPASALGANEHDVNDYDDNNYDANDYDASDYSENIDSDPFQEVQNAYTAGYGPDGPDGYGPDGYGNYGDSYDDDYDDGYGGGDYGSAVSDDAGDPTLTGYGDDSEAGTQGALHGGIGGIGGTTYSDIYEEALADPYREAFSPAPQTPDPQPPNRRSGSRPWAQPSSQYPPKPSAPAGAHSRPPAPWPQASSAAAASAQARAVQAAQAAQAAQTARSLRSKTGLTASPLSGATGSPKPGRPVSPRASTPRASTPRTSSPRPSPPRSSSSVPSGRRSSPAVARSPQPRATRPRRTYSFQEDYEFVPGFKVHEEYRPRRLDYRFWVLGGVLLVGLTILIEPTRVISSIVKTKDYECQEVVQPSSVLSREQLTQLLTIPERSPKDEVRAVMEEPYCLLPSVTIRAGIPTVREAYPLEFDPDMWIVMLYEGDEYAGYRFNAR